MNSTKNNCDYVVVAALVLKHFGVCPPIDDERLLARITWCALGECPERKEADRQINELENKFLDPDIKRKAIQAAKNAMK